ncbi:MAG TPA: hypothetical protein P5210_15920 [Draconibacterium sp.]|nr:hypothetical protein [Draconibacterium sp.]
MSLNGSKKRDFISLFISILEQNGELLVEKGYDPLNKIAQLKEEIAITDHAEAFQAKAKADAKNATKAANAALNVAYTDASAAVDLVSGLLGKDDNLLLEIKKLRNTPPPPPPPNNPE